ncbi:MAG: septum formation inhibitor Maf [Deltaproteobacteria bacterium]|nr:septum formation inhibitor Maf [Deltaproteobacteria bacterium]
MCNIRLVLASGSPRRKALMAAAGFRFDIIESGIDEGLAAGEPGQDYARRIAREKALAVSARVPDALVLAADTIVVCDNEVLVKPNDESEACRMLATLSGRTHTVITAYALASAGAILAVEPVTSDVTFHSLSDEQIRQYVASGEPLDKAGAYGIQGRGANLIAKVVGSRDNVMGLPLREVTETLARFGVLSAKQPYG